MISITAMPEIALYNDTKNINARQECLLDLAKTNIVISTFDYLEAGYSTLPEFGQENQS